MINIDFAEVHRLATVSSLIEPLRRAFAAHAITPERAHFDLDDPADARSLLLMPAWRPGQGIGVKIVTVFPGNADRGLPSVNAAYLLLSWQTGVPLATIDGRGLTLLRTAAVSALAADLLAPKDCEVLLMVGTGALAPYLIEGHRAVRNYRSILIWGRNADKAAAAARDLKARGWPVSAAADLETAARSADVISCATLARAPLIQGSWLKTHCHLDLVGSFTPDMREADDACARGAFIAVDTHSALQTSGDLLAPLASGAAARDAIVLLGDLIAHAAVAHAAVAHEPIAYGSLAHGAATRGAGIPRPERTLFKTVGVAHADLAAAQTLYERCIG
jgi:ornithine cyclodeaminase